MKALNHSQSTKFDVANDPAALIEKNRILMISATFPPRGGSGVQRFAYQASFFSKYGWDVSVVTEGRPNSWVTDNSIQVDALHADRILRINADPGLAGKFRQRIGKYLLLLESFPDRYAKWRRRAFKAAMRVVEERRVNTVFVSLGHPSALGLAYDIKQEIPHLTLVVDVRDLWVGNPAKLWRPSKFHFIHSQLDAIFEKRWFSSVDAVATVSQEHCNILQKRYPHLSSHHFVVVHNGFDEELFQNRPPNEAAEETLVIRYLGFLLPEMRPETFFQALSATVEKQLEKRLEVEFYGGNPGYVQSLADRYGVSEIVSAHHYVPHDQAVSLMKGADVLLLFWTDDPGCMCGKLYEYLRAKRFVLAIEQGNVEARQLLSEKKRGTWISNDDVHKIERTLQMLIEKHQAAIPLLNQHVSVNEYSREAQALRLLEFINSLS